MHKLHIERVTQRYWFWHPRYREARKYKYACWKPWKPYIDWVVEHRYFIDGKEFAPWRSSNG